MIEPALVVAGPTASGKSSVGIELARRHGFEIVSVDSRQCFRGMSIGSAVPAAEELAAVPHHLVECFDPLHGMTAGKYGRLARAAIGEVQARGKRALLVGGSGLYLRAVLGGIDADLPRDDAVRRALVREAESIGSVALHARLAELDPDSAAAIEPGDQVRIVRALELIELTGRPASELRASAGQPRYQARIAVLLWDRDALEKRIRLRTRRMIEAGLVSEVRALLDRGLVGDHPVMKSVGYAETIQYLNGGLDAGEWEERMVINTRRYAKRQRTWFRSTPGVIDVPVHPDESVEDQTTRVESALGLS